MSLLSQSEVSKIVLQKYAGFKIDFLKMPFAGSEKIFFILQNNKINYFGFFEPNEQYFENLAYLFQKQSLFKNIFPAFIDIFPQEKILIMEYLGNKHLYDISDRKEELLPMYKQALDKLYRFQKTGKENIAELKLLKNFGLEDFLWETSYFEEYVLNKYCSLKHDNILWNAEMQQLADICNSTPKNTLMHRDFQSKNILLHNNNLFFIDLQNIKIGTIYYDLVSLIFDPYKNFDWDFSQELLRYYEKLLSQDTIFSFSLEVFYAFALQRLMQASAAYIKLGYFQKKEWFFQFFIPTIKRISDVLELSESFPYIKQIISDLIKKEEK